MEPAADRRGYEAKKLTAYTTIPPQWSPPVTGGNIWRILSDALAFIVPQWSPPLNGGSIAINETMQAYGTLPQWSPPVTGGTTARGFRAV